MARQCYVSERLQRAMAVVSPRPAQDHGCGHYILWQEATTCQAEKEIDFPQNVDPRMDTDSHR
jgi:hypothetical protein